MANLPYDPMTPAIQIPKQSTSPMQTVRPSSAKPAQASKSPAGKPHFVNPPGNIMNRKADPWNRNA